MRVFVYFILLAAIMLGILWACQTLFLEDFYTSIKLSRAKEALSAVTDALDDDSLQDSAVSIGKYYDVSIKIYDEGMTKLAYSDSIPNDTLMNMNGGELLMLYKKAVSEGGTYTERWKMKGPEAPSFIADGKDKYGETDLQETGAETAYPHKYEDKHPVQSNLENIIIVSVVTTDAGATRIVFLNSVLTPVTETVETLKVQLTFISIFMLVLAFLLALLFGRQIAKPIEKINDTAAKLAEGDYGVQFDESSRCREVAELSATLNYATQELSQVDRLRGELIANISHDLRTPLTMITGYSEMMRDIPGENTPENADVIIAESKRLTTLVNDVLNLSKYKTGALELGIFSVTGMIREIIGRYAKFTEQNGYRIEFSPAGELFAEGDEIQLQQVLYNLVNNAINYTGEDKTVQVVQKREDAFVKIEVIDSGAGITEDDLPHIFERYYRSSSPHKRATVGTGIGLSIVKTILESHGAPYGVITSVGQGSVFWFKLPLREVEDAAQSTAKPHRAHGGAKK